MLFFILYFSCGEPPQRKLNVIGTDVSADAAEIDSVDTKETLAQTKRDLKCIKVYLEDEVEANRLNVSQKPIEDYEINDCKYLIKTPEAE